MQETTYGAPRIHAELREEGERLGRKRVARRMRESGLRGVDRRKWMKTTAPDLVRRDFSASAADELWVADATYVPTLAGFLFLAVGVDVYSRRIVGWCMGAELVTRLMLGAVGTTCGRPRERRRWRTRGSFGARPGDRVA